MYAIKVNLKKISKKTCIFKKTVLYYSHNKGKVGESLRRKAMSLTLNSYDCQVAEILGFGGILLFVQSFLFCKVNY